MFGRFGAWEILLIVVLVVILFGSAKIPGMMKNLANGITTFKKELNNDTRHNKTATVKKSGVKKSNTGKKTVRM